MATFRVSTPVPGYSGSVGEVHFADGVALVDDATHGAELGYCRAAGYTVEVATADAAEQVAEVEAAQAVETEERATDGEEAPPAVGEMPKKSASTEAWRAWAVARGMSAEEAGELSRDQLVERFTSTEEINP